MRVHVQYLYHETQFDCFEYMGIKVSCVTQQFIDLYNINDKAKNWYIYIEIQKHMYGLTQSGVLANKIFKETSHRMVTMNYPTYQVCGNITTKTKNSP